ncbi:uncharacterized protein LODBEIA_P59650 [Lodderomyces beijingensis]|uniref:Mediator of RNA polymerase II transcription subunit 9 n=1 Tax=Lodderomyces beijingensis TaxID=1775926 RepID=A0ABP0ZUD4_9ASCO
MSFEQAPDQKQPQRSNPTIDPDQSVQDDLMDLDPSSTPAAQKQPQQEDDPIAKIAEIELLPELYSLLFDITNGNKQAKDFDKYVGALRLKLAKLKSSIQEIEGLDESPETTKAKIHRLRENNLQKRLLLDSFRRRVDESL